MARSRSHRNDDGLAMVEFAIVGSLLCLLLFGIISMGLLFENVTKASDQARVAARALALACTPDEISNGVVKTASQPVTVTWLIPGIPAPSVPDQKVSYRCGG
jgi:Flp pilus assembly protein TadG